MAKAKLQMDPETLQLSDYKVEELIGEGSLGTVYRAEDTRSNKIIALKVLRPSAAVHAQRLQNEFRLLSTLQHPYLADVYDYGLTQDLRPYFAMEWIDGEPVSHKHLLENGKISYQRFAEFVRQISSALIYIKQRNLAHGDLKPENILVSIDKSGEIHSKVMDFGISRDLSAAGNGISGTFEYMAPELVRAEAATPASDLYSFGCVLYELLFDSPPFTADTPLEILKKHLQEEVPELAPEIIEDESVRSWVHTLLQKDVRLRYRVPEQLHQLSCEYLEKEPDVQMREADSFSAQLVLVSRENEKAKLQELLSSSSEKFECACIIGSEGIGKTYLLSDMKVECQLAGHKVFHGQIVESPAPFMPILSLLKEANIANLEDDLARSAGIVTAFFPGTFPTINPVLPEGLTGDAEILRLFNAAAELLVSTGISAMLLDDLHLADDLTQEFIAYFISYAKAQSVTGLILLLAYEPASINRDAMSEDIEAECTSIALRPLSKDQISKNIEIIFSGDMSPSFNEFIWKHTGGNPGQIESILQFCIDETIVERTRHGWILHERDDLATALPVSLSDRQQRSLAKLEEAEVQLLKAIVLSPVSVEPTMLEHVTGKGIEKIHDACAHLFQYELIDYTDGRYMRKHESIKTLLEYAEDEEARLQDHYVDYYKQHRSVHPGNLTLAEHYKSSSQSTEAVSYYIEASKESTRIFDYKATHSALTNALAIPDGIPDDDNRFKIYDSMVRNCNILGNRDCESEYIEEMLILAGRWKSRKGAQRLATAYSHQTEYHLALADFERAKRSAERSLKFFKEARDDMGVGRCQQKIGFIEYRTHPSEKVIGFYQDAREIFANNNALLDEANVLIDIGLVYYSILKNPDEALRCYDEARAKFSAANMERGVARCYGNTGVQHYVLGDYELALQNHQKANEIFQRIGDFRATAISHLHIGRCQSALGLYLPAIHELETALQIGRTLADSYVQENCNENLGEVFFFMGQYDEAEACFSSARMIAAKTGFRIGEITNTLDIAQIQIEQGHSAEALEQVSACVKAFSEIKDAHVEAVSLLRFAQIYLERGDLQDFGKALEYLSKLNEAAAANGFDALKILALSYAALSHAHRGHPGEALALSENAQQLLDLSPFVVGGKQSIYLNHARVLRVNKRAEEAETFIKRAYDEVMRIADGIDDPKLYRSYTETVKVNAEIIREHSLLNRSSSPESLSVTRDQNLTTLYDVSRKINSILDLPQLLQNIMDSALEAMNGERGMIFLLENEDLVLKVSRNVERETIKDATEISLSILRDVVTGGKPIIISDTSKDDEVKKRESVVNYNIHSIICVPMKSKDEIIGTVYVDSRSDALSAMSFSEIDVDFLEAFSNLATIAIENARMHTRLQEENIYLKKEVVRQFGFENIIGSSKAMEHLFRETQSAIGSDDSVLISGESGTGKELIARAIHYNGKRKDKHFVAVDCGAMQETLLESELFGYKRGAFTGAISDRKGLFEEANKGTLFLDEISNTSLAFQSKLLRVLQEGDFRRVGDTETRRVDVRVIAATNTNIQKQISDGVFRQDLYYRLNVIPIRVPLLKERLEDIPLLINHFVQLFNQKNNSTFEGASKELIEILQRYDWPGNVRELENLLNRMLVQAETDLLTTKNLPADFESAPSRSKKSRGKDFTMKVPAHMKTLKEVEQEHILQVLSYTGNNKTEAAKFLGLKRTTLVEKMKKLGIM
jgi:Nif-specific regulatory protein